MDDRRRASSAQERKVARKFGAKQHAGSGSGHARHDSHTTAMANRTIHSGLLIECKTTVGSKKQITIRDDDLKSVEHVALLQGRTPVLMIEVAGRRYGVMTEDDIFEREQEREAWQQENGGG